MADAPDRTYLQSAMMLAHHNWGAVELAMSEMFAAAADIADERKAFAPYNTIISFEVRLSLLDALVAMENGWDDVEREMCARLSARLTRLYKKRHAIAHFMLPQDQGTIGIIPFATAEKYSAGKDILSPDEIAALAQKFVEACALVFWFSRLARRLRPNAEIVSPLEVPEPAHVARLRELAIQNLAAPKRQPQADPVPPAFQGRDVR